MASDKQNRHNWIKASLSLLYLKEGLAEELDDQAVQFHDHIKKLVASRCAAAVTAPRCTNCTSKLIKRSKTLTNAGTFWYINCKTNVCNQWLNTFIQFHEHMPGPNVEWANCDPTLWTSQPWEVAKVFQPFGCKNHKNAEESDVAGLLTLVLNCQFFHKLVSNTQMLRDIKECRNKTMHSATLEVEDAEIKDWLDMMIGLLEDKTHLGQLDTCKAAADKIRELRDKSIEISFDKDDANEALCLQIATLTAEVANKQRESDDIRSCLGDLTSEQSEESKHIHEELSATAATILKLNEQIEILQKTLRDSDIPHVKDKLVDLQQRLQSISEQNKEDIRQVVDKIGGIESQVDKMTSEMGEVKSDMGEVKTEIGEVKSEMVEVKSDMGEVKTEIGEVKTEIGEVKSEIGEVKSDMGEVKTEIGEVKSEIGEVKSELSGFQHQLQSHEEKINSLHNDKDSDKDVVGEIQQYLVSLYNENCQTVPLYPLRPEWREHVQDLYVIPNMVETNPRGVDLEYTTDRAGLVSRDTRESKVADIRSIFYKGDTLCTEIYLVGESGSGKTVLCEYLVHLWVKCHSPSSAIVDKNNFMKKFAFLFYISLRDAKSHVVKDMIIDQFENIPHATDMSNLLLGNTWLLILDGLDEYSQTSKSSRFGSQNIPKRQYSPTSNCVTITTSRPWKIELLRKELELKMHRQISIVGLEDNKQKQLAKKVLDLLNREKGRNKSFKDFFEAVINQKLSKQLESPVLLMQMLGLWFSEKSFGRSQCDIYSNTVEMQLQFMEEIKGISVDQTHLTTETEAQVQLPACFKDLVRCQKYKSLLLKLSRLANQQLFSKNREDTLVFDHDQMEFSGMSKSEIELCLKLGLLTQFKVMGEITQRRKSVSFVHKSHQEFFAAIYLSQTAEDADMKQILEGFSDLDRALEIEKVFTFVSGMNPSVSCKIAKAIMQRVNLDPRVQQYRESCAYLQAPNEDLVKRIQGVILAGIEEGENNDVNTPPLQLQDIWMKNDDRDFPPSRIFACKTALDLSHVKSLLIYKPGDISRDDIWRLVKASLANLQKLVLWDCDISEERVKEDVRRNGGDLQALGLFYEMWRLFKASLANLQKLVLWDCDISVERVKEVVRRNGGDLQALGLYYDGIDGVDFSRLSQEDLQHILAAPNKSLGLAKVRLTHAHLGFLSHHLSTRSFTELSLCRLYCTEHGTSGECLSLDLTRSRDINILELVLLPIQNVAFHPERLVRCNIAGLPETVTADVTRCLRGAEQLGVLWCGGYAASALVELSRTLPSLTNLRVICLHSVDLRAHEQLMASPDQKRLEHIVLGAVTLTADHLRRLLASLPPHRVEVILGYSGETVTITGDTTDLIKELRDSPDIGVTKKGDVKREGGTCTVGDFEFYTNK